MRNYEKKSFLDPYLSNAMTEHNKNYMVGKGTKNCVIYEKTREKGRTKFIMRNYEKTL